MGKNAAACSHGPIESVAIEVPTNAAPPNAVAGSAHARQRTNAAWNVRIASIRLRVAAREPAEFWQQLRVVMALVALAFLAILAFITCLACLDRRR